MIDKQVIAKSFGLAASTYDSVAHFQRWVGDKLIDELKQKEPDFSPRNIVDLGCGTGYFAQSLQTNFSSADYIGLDLSENMINFSKQSHTSECAWLVGDAESLPFKDHSIDLIFSSLAIQWCESLPRLMKEISRVLSPKGLFVFSSLVDGSLEELKIAWSKVDDKQHVNNFFLKEEYQQAVFTSDLSIHLLSEETKILRYQKLTDLMKELKKLGAHNLNNERSTVLMGKHKLNKVIAEYERFRVDNDYLPASYDVLLGILSNKG